MAPVPKEQSARRGEKVKGKTQGNLNGQRGKAWERAVAKSTGGKRVPTSGAGSIKGDVLTEYTLAECKMSAAVDAKGGKQITVKREWLLKMRQEAESEGKLIAVLPLHFAGCADNYALLPFETFRGMLGQLEGLYKLSAWLDRNPSIAAQLPLIEMPGIGKPLFTVIKTSEENAEND